VSRRVASTAGTLAGTALLILMLLPCAVAAHEVLHAVERGRAIAVHAWFPDGQDLAYATYEVFSPADPKLPHQKGRTDRKGWLAFVPDAPGRWRVKVVDGTGHGLELEVDASSEAGPAKTSTAAVVLRPVVGVLVIAAVFAALALAYRRKGHSP
jgi:nickel transport protein